MDDRGADSLIETRLEHFLASELRRAERDYQQMSAWMPVSHKGAGRLGVAALVVCLVAVGALLRPWGGLVRNGPGGYPLGPDGIPLSIDGQPVLRGADIDIRLASKRDLSSFLVGGYLVLRPVVCPSPAPAPGESCDEDWRLEDAPDGSPRYSVRLDTASAGTTFVRTSGAPTVFRVQPIANVISNGLGIDRPKALLVEAVAWRQATKGRIPNSAMPPEGGQINDALVPDFIGVWGGPTGESIVGYAPKELMLDGPSPIGGSPGNPAPDVPVPVYGEDLTTLVGHMVAGRGFVPVSSSPPPSAPVVATASAGPP
jgi:hypothetical protein